MSDLTIGEVGKKLRLTLVDVDQTVSPPVQSPLNLTGASVFLRYLIGERGKEVSVEKTMTIVDPVNGIVEYAFVTGDLNKPTDFNLDGSFQYEVRVVLPGGITLFSSEVLKLAIKDQVP